MATANDDRKEQDATEAVPGDADGGRLADRFAGLVVMPVQPVAVSREQAAAMFGVSPSAWDARRGLGLVPEPDIDLSIGSNPTGKSRMVRWSVERLVQWAREGCPAVRGPGSRRARR